MATNTPEFLALEEVSAYLNIAKSTIYKLSQKGELPSCKIGKQLRFKKSSLDQWIARKENGAVLSVGGNGKELKSLRQERAQRVLLIDDDDLVLKAISRFLGNQGYAVVTAATPEQALAIVTQEHLDLIITDIRMPGMDGIETVKRIRTINQELNRPPVPEIIITGYLDTAAEREAQQLGVTDYVYKPFAIAEFLDTVKAKLHLEAAS